MSDLSKYVEDLIKRASKSNDALEALQLSEAATNAADAIATAADRVQTGLDVTSTAASASIVVRITL